MSKRVKEFMFSEDGAVSTDWVVVSGLVVGLCIAVYTAVGGIAVDHGALVGDTMVARGIVTY
ncbi:MAG: hypothetical protein AAGP08_07200 [Pseudomonadota bacterium]